ncbi:MAG: hypothetical protein SFY67_15725 [Candidatus Melainabacteria bacterium]|nr:hypothetical protein [Candidatus Melainabacteria bacterium]
MNETFPVISKVIQTIIIVMAWIRNDEPEVLEKVVSAATYLPCWIGFGIGILFILFNGKGCNNRFFRFNFYQGALLGLLGSVIIMGMGYLVGLMEGLLAMAGLSMAEAGQAAGYVIWSFMVAFQLLALYGLVFSLLGRFAEIPFISDVIRQNIR